MNTHPVPSGAQGLIDELRRRYPMLDSVLGQFGESLPQERIPWFFGLLAAAATVPGSGSSCVVLNKTTGTAAIVATLLALTRLQSDFPKLAEEYARTALIPGQLVRVKPNNFVYEYDGLWEGHPGHFRLRVRGSTDRRSFPIEDVIRLEPTDRRLPRGTLTSKYDVPERGKIDRLLDLTTYGNNSMIRNTVLAYMPQTQFSEIADTVSLMREGNDSSDRLSSFLPWGAIGPSGELKAVDRYQVVGEPLIAVTREAQDLADASKLAREASKIVIIDGARGMVRDLQAFDDIAERQRVLILASPNENEEIRQLRDRSVPVWHLSPTETLIGENHAEDRQRTSLVGQTIRATDTRSRSRITTIDCSDDGLQNVAESLERIAQLIVGEEELTEVDDLLARLYGVLFEFSEFCFGFNKDMMAKANLAEVRDNLTRTSMWLTPVVAGEFRVALTLLESAFDSGANSSDKADAMLNTVVEDGSWAVATRTPRAAEHLREGLRGLGADVPVMPMNAFRPDHEYDGIIIPTWPNGRRLAGFMSSGVSQDIRILTYPFERKWVAGYQTRERARVRSNRIGIDDLSSLLGIESCLLAGLETSEPDQSGSERQHDAPIFRIEERVARRRRTQRPYVPTGGSDTRQARLVQFVGDCYALLTEWSDWYVLNGLTSNRQGDNAEPRRVAAPDLVRGDIVLFRDSGDKEFLRLGAEEIMGAEEYQRIRSISERWKVGLRRLGSRPDGVRQRLERRGLYRATPTIAAWLNNPNRIGPRDDSDIAVIAQAAGDTYLTLNVGKVKEAISTIRKAHQGAGRLLTQRLPGELRGRLSEMSDRPILLDLGFGKAWVVQIDSIDREQQDCPASQVNRLKWTDDVTF